MIYLISDLHGDLDCAALADYVKLAKEDDLLIILGDLELAFRPTEENRAFTAYFLSLPCRIAFIDGNHENFDYLETFPEEDWCGGRVHRLSPSIVHLMRGYVFDLEGSTFFTMGGCKSSQKWVDQGLFWPQENPTPAELARGRAELTRRGNAVDYILTHKYRLEADPAPDSLEAFMYTLDGQVAFKHWYSGHWHKFKQLDPKHTVIGKKTVVPLAEV